MFSKHERSASNGIHSTLSVDSFSQIHKSVFLFTPMFNITTKNGATAAPILTTPLKVLGKKTRKKTKQERLAVPRQ